MIGALRATGIAVAAVVAIGSVATAGAQAEVEYFHSHQQHTIITGESLNTQTLALGPEAPFLKCAGAKLAGTVTLGEQHVGEFGTTFTDKVIAVHPEYYGAGGPGTSCTHAATEGIALAVSTGTCHFELTSSTEAGKAPLHIQCGAGAIEIKFNTCVVKIATQTPTAGGISYENNKAGETGEWDFKAVFEVEGISFTTNGSSWCPVIGIPEEGKEASLTGEFTVKGFEDLEATETGTYEEGAQVGIWKGPAE